ncbi:Glutaredoxin-2-like protein [Drosera capensis]
MANEINGSSIPHSPGSLGPNSKIFPQEIVCNGNNNDEFTDIDIESKEIMDGVEENHVTEISFEEEVISEEQTEPSSSSPVNEDNKVETENPSQGDEAAASMAEASSILHPHKDFPQPVAPNNLLKSRSYPGGAVSVFGDNQSENFPIDVPAIGKFIKERSTSLKAEISKRINSNSKYHDRENGDVTEFTLSGVKVIVQERETPFVEDTSSGVISISNHNEDDLSALKGRVTFFSRSNCRDCRAVRSFLRERGLKYAEINVDVFPGKQKELMEQTGSTTVPQIFFNEKLIGGLVALNSMRNSGVLEKRLREMLAGKCPDDALAPVAYGFDDPDEEEEDRTAGIVRILRQRLPIQDRLIKMRIVRNCFTGNDLVDVIVRHFGCDRVKAVEIGKELARKHFIHHVFGGYDFQDGNKTYRFLEHELFIKKCFNFRGSADEREPQDAAAITDKLAKIMYAILESYASEDRRHVDYISINNSEEFRRYLKLIQGLHRVDISALSSNQRLAFFLNLYNAMVIHGMIRMGYPEGIMERKPLVADFLYLIGGHPYSLSTIKNGILRSNRRPLYSLIKPFNAGDARLELALPAVNPLIHFGLCDGAKSCPTVRFFTPQNAEAELRHAAREYFQRGGLEVDLGRRTVYLSRIFKWYGVDFGSNDREILNWIMSYLDASRAGLLTHLLSDGGVVNIAHQTYDWSLNS